MNHHPRLKFQVIITLFVFCIIFSCQKKSEFTPPETTKIEFEYQKFNEKIKDTYQWLENEDSLPVKTWIKLQDDFTKTYIDENLETKKWVENRMQELTKDVNYDTPILSDSGRRFFIENNYEKSQPILKFQKDDSSPHEVLIDPNLLSEDGSVVLSNFIPSPSGKLLLYSLSNGNSRYKDWKLLNVDTKSELKDVILAANVNIQSWLPNDEGYIYRTYQNLDRKNESFVPNTYLIKKHIIGQDSTNDEVLFRAEKGEVINAFLNDDAQQMVIVNGTTATDVYLKKINESEKSQQILSGKSKGIYYQYVHNEGNKYWFLTTENSPNGKLIQIEVSKQLVKVKKEIISIEDENINQAFVFGKHFVLHTLNKAKPYLRVYDLDGNFKNKVELPVGLTWNSFTPAFQQGISGHKNRSDIYIRSQGLTASNSVYKYDIDQGELKMYQKSTTPFQSENYITKQVFYKSKDGTEVPMFITHKKGLELNGKNPTLVYVYGSFGWTALPFITRKYALFLEQGGIHVMPNIRGGGALGADWYKEGRSLQKKNGIDDTVAAVEWLIDHKYTSSDRVIIEGNSAGGIVAMSAVNKAPNLFKVALLEFPIFDMAKAMEFNKSASRWKSQFGDPSKEEDFKYLYSYSPYHRVKTDENYPSIFIAAGEKDRVASPIHSYKMTAKLQENKKSPSLLWVNWNGGHGGKNEKERTQLRIAELIFVFNELNIVPK